MTVPKFTLVDGTSVPAIAFGTVSGSKSGQDIDQAILDRIKSAIKKGYRHFDTAEGYGTEPELGIAIAESGLPRSEFFITSKVKVAKGSIDNIEQAVKKGLSAMKTDYFDLYLIHNPWFTKESHGVSIEEAWAQLEEVKAKGLVRNIGVSNFRPKTLQQVLDVAKIKPAVNQIELHPYCFEQDTIEFGRKHGIITASYGPLIPVARRKEGPIPPLIEELATKYSVTPAQILLRWQLQHGFIPVTSTSQEERQKTQFDLESFELSREEVDKITDEGKKYPLRYFGWGSGREIYDINAPTKPLPEGTRF